MDFKNYECDGQMSLFDITEREFKIDKPIRLIELYKQAGNSIVRNVLVAIFGQMLPGKEGVYKNVVS